MTHSALRTAESCLGRAVAMKETADRLAESDSEWAAVCYFYSAYHTMKAAFIEDPIFEDPAGLRGLSQHLIPDDRYVTHHRARMGPAPRKLGVNDIVQVLYPTIAPRYIRLHMASVAVRYESGLGVISFATVLDDYRTITASYRGLRLRASSPD